MARCTREPNRTLTTTTPGLGSYRPPSRSDRTLNVQLLLLICKSYSALDNTWYTSTLTCSAYSGKRSSVPVACIIQYSPSISRMKNQDGDWKWCVCVSFYLPTSSTHPRVRDASSSCVLLIERYKLCWTSRVDRKHTTHSRQHAAVDGGRNDVPVPCALCPTPCALRPLHVSCRSRTFASAFTSFRIVYIQQRTVYFWYIICHSNCVPIVPSPLLCLL